MPRLRRRAFPQALLAFFFLQSLLSSVINAQGPFNHFPEGARDCLDKSLDESGCNNAASSRRNQCLCEDEGNFITNSARCIRREAPNTLSRVWEILDNACGAAQRPLNMTEEEFIDVANGNTPTSSLGGSSTSTTSGGSSSTTDSQASQSTTPPQSTGTQPSSASSTPVETAPSSGDGSNVRGDNKDDDDDSTEGLSAAAKAGIGLGSTIAAITLIGIIGLVFKCRRSRAAQDDARRPMLNDNQVLAWQLGGQTPRGDDSDGGFTPRPSGGMPTEPRQEWKTADGKPGWRPTSGFTNLTLSPTSTSMWTLGGGAQNQQNSQNSQQQQQQQTPQQQHQPPNRPDPLWPATPSTGEQQHLRSVPAAELSPDFDRRGGLRDPMRDPRDDTAYELPSIGPWGTASPADPMVDGSNVQRGYYSPYASNGWGR